VQGVILFVAIFLVLLGTILLMAGGTQNLITVASAEQLSWGPRPVPMRPGLI
jgi:hypothetical protein